ncbi:hypothetical protein [Roseibium sp.]|uniref:hypothetical protein n=1 Tax=Roseibium sp. TaxID=1936156 RepID=UPI003B514397
MSIDPNTADVSSEFEVSAGLLVWAGSGLSLRYSQITELGRAPFLPVRTFSDDTLPSVLRPETELAQLEVRQAARARVQKVLEDGDGSGLDRG